MAGGPAKQAARQSAAARYEQFKQHVAATFQGGRRFLDDLPREVIADEAELSEIAARSTPGASPERSEASPIEGDDEE